MVMIARAGRHDAFVDSTLTGHVWKRQQPGGGMVDRPYELRGTVWRMLKEIIGDVLEIVCSFFGPAKLHQGRGCFSVNRFRGGRRPLHA